MEGYIYAAIFLVNLIIPVVLSFKKELFSLLKSKPLSTQEVADYKNDYKEILDGFTKFATLQAFAIYLFFRIIKLCHGEKIVPEIFHLILIFLVVLAMILVTINYLYLITLKSNKPERFNCVNFIGRFFILVGAAVLPTFCIILIIDAEYFTKIFGIGG